MRARLVQLEWRDIGRYREIQREITSCSWSRAKQESRGTELAPPLAAASSSHRSHSRAAVRRGSTVTKTHMSQREAAISTLTWLGLGLGIVHLVRLGLGLGVVN